MGRHDMPPEMEARTSARTGQTWPPPRAVPDPPTEGIPVDVEDRDRTYLSNRLVSWLRTVIPVAWGAAITWGLSWVKVPPWVVHYVAQDPTVVAAVSTVVTLVWYTLWRSLEKWIPGWIVAVLLGHPSPPIYP